MRSGYSAAMPISKHRTSRALDRVLSSPGLTFEEALAMERDTQEDEPSASGRPAEVSRPPELDQRLETIIIDASLGEEQSGGHEGQYVLAWDPADPTKFFRLRVASAEVREPAADEQIAELLRVTAMYRTGRAGPT